MNQPRQPDTIRRSLSGWLPILIFVAWLVYLLFRDGADAFGLVSLALVLFWTGALWLIDRRSTRPRRTFYWLAMASSVAAAIFIAMPAADGAPVLLGTIAWAGVTLLGFIWCLYFERSEAGR